MTAEQFLDRNGEKIKIKSFPDGDHEICINKVIRLIEFRHVVFDHVTPLLLAYTHDSESSAAATSNALLVLYHKFPEEALNAAYYLPRYS